MQPSYDADDQDFQPTKKPRTLCRLHTSAATPQSSTVIVSAATCQGKENRTPANTVKGLETQQGVDTDSEALPLRQPHQTLATGTKQPLVAPIPVAPHFSKASRLPVRAFFTRSRSTPSCHGQPGLSNSAADPLCIPAACQGPQTPACNFGSIVSICSQANRRQEGNYASDQETPVALRPMPAQAQSYLSSQSDIAPLHNTAAAVAACPALTAVASPATNSAAGTSPALTSHNHAAHTAGCQSAVQRASIAPTPLPGNFIVLDASDSDDEDASDNGHIAELQTQALQSEQAVAAWLKQHGLSAYAAAFNQAEVDLSLIPCLTDDDLKQMGVTALGPRRKILAAAAKLAMQSADEHTSDGVSHPVGCQKLAANKAGAEGTAEIRTAGKDAFAMLMQQARQDQGKPGSAGGLGGDKTGVQAPTDALSFLMQQARGGQPSNTSAASTSSSRSHKSGSSRAGPVRLPEWQLVPGTRFVVDKFGSKASEAAPQTKHWFLTHFHADHYGGLGPRFKQGTIYCSPITARLVHQRLKVPLGRLQVVPLHSPVQVAGVTVTFLDAHHCPGAVMILFEAPGKLPLLHTGDCRCHAGMQAEECLQRLRGSVDLVLDTTYCQPQYIFPKQEEVLSFVLDAVKAEAFNEKRTLFLFGSYTIGKEKLFLEVARVLQQKMYVSMAKRKILECLELPAETLSLLTSNDKETNLHAVPLWSVTLKSMARLLKHYRGRYTTVVGFQPTGWTQKQDRGRTGQGRRRQKGTLITYQVPYSEHSSFPEMKEFVSWLRPRRIIPSVGNDHHGPKAAHMVSLLLAPT